MKRKSIRVGVFVLILMVAINATLAQSEPDNIELVGIVEAVGDGSVTISGQTIDISLAEIGVELSAGQIVKIEGRMQDDGSILAREVDMPGDDPRPGEIELVGEVESINGTVITIQGLEIDLTLAEINGVLEVGTLGKIHASFADDGTLAAREADFGPDILGDENDDDLDDDVDRAGEFEITGTLDEIGDGFIVVNGQTIEISGAEIKNDLVPGALVKIHLSNQDGQLVAREVENALDDDDDDNDSDHDDSDDAVDDEWDDSYTVQPGDTLSDIAARSGTTVEELARVNGIEDTSTVIAGTSLLVPHEIESDDDDGDGSHDDADDSDDDDDSDDSHDDADDNDADDDDDDSDDDHDDDSDDDDDDSDDDHDDDDDDD